MSSRQRSFVEREAIRSRLVEVVKGDPELSVADVARRFDVSTSTVSNWCRAAGISPKRPAPMEDERTLSHAIRKHKAGAR